MPPAFGLSQHVQVVPLPAPGDEAALLLATEQLRRRRLDRSRPLWQMCFLPGLPANRVGMFAKMHHAIANGIAGMATLGTLLDAVPDAPTRPVQPWTPAPAPTAPDLFADNLRRHTGNLGRALSALAQPATTTRHLMAAWPAIRELFAEEPGPRTSLDRVVGPDRNLALIRANLDQVRHIAHTHHATVNDVLLAVTADGLRGLLRSRGEPIEDVVVPIYVPVTLRQAQLRDQARGNLIGQMIVPLPIGVPDPSRRLEQIATETATRKAESHPSLGTLLRSRIARQAEDLGPPASERDQRRRTRSTDAALPRRGTAARSVPAAAPHRQGAPRRLRTVLRRTVQHHGRRRPRRLPRPRHLRRQRPRRTADTYPCGSGTSMVNRVVRSTSVPIADVPAVPISRPPSQCPGTARSAASAGRSLATGRSSQAIPASADGPRTPPPAAR
jgi:wax ester synthase-like acyl-CoA acyltransferase family protein